MSTTLAKNETVQRKWYVIDAAGKPLGRTAVIAANLLRGKHKVDFTPNVDCGDFVIIINTDKAILTGNKLDQKSYYRVSGWIGDYLVLRFKINLVEAFFSLRVRVPNAHLPQGVTGRLRPTGE